jgi:uncharacterized iron-regulated protein
MPFPTSGALARALAVCLVLIGIAPAAASEPAWRAWVEEVQTQHPLAGKVYHVGLGKLLDPTENSPPVLPDGLVLLGEVHDNPAHHKLRGWLIAEAVRARPQWRPAVVFEHIDTGRQPALDKFAALADGSRPSPTADDLLRLLDWDKSGWPPAQVYRPLFEAVVDAKLPIIAGNAPRDLVRAVARGGSAASAPEERARLRLDDPMPAPLAGALDRELAESHCGALPPQAIPGMAAAQRYRDARLADALLSAAERDGSAILIAGNGHVRADRGVPWHIWQRAPRTPVISAVLVEVEDGKTDPTAYMPRDPDGKPAADLLIFTPRAERADPCEKFRKR